MQSLQEGKPDFESLIEHMAHGFAYCRMQYEHGLPIDFTYLSVNPAFERITGLNGVVGKRVTEVIPGIKKSNPELLNIYGRVALSGWKECFETYVSALSVWFAVTVYSPEKGYFVATFENITKRKLAEETLRESNGSAIRNGLLKDQALIELNAINNNALIGIAVSSIIPATNRVILRANRHLEETLFGYGQGELVGKSVRILYASQEDFDAVARTLIPQLTSTRGSCVYEANFIRKDGAVFLGRGTVTLVDQKDDAKGVITLLQDITDERRTKDKLQASLRDLEEKESAKSRFLASAGHDLRQPLAAANLFIDALKFTKPTADQNQIILRLDQAMSNFNDLLDALLNVSKLDAGIIKPEYVQISVAEVFNWLEDSFISLTNEKHLRFKLYYPMKTELFIRSDIGLLKSVLMNIVSNAIKFTSAGGILVSARHRGNDVLFQVWDTGIGIQDENVEKIFDDFYQVDNSQRDRAKGLGLGLSIVKRALALIDGKITCRSKSGRGSVFEFRLPIDNNLSEVTHAKPVIESQDIEGNANFVQGKRFVVLEDDLLVAEALSLSLKMLGAKVECFDDAEKALQHLNIENADCYIVDYMLNGTVDGINFLHLLHQKLHRHVCAVMMSGDTSTAFIRKAAMFDYPVIHKPVNLSKLISRLIEQHNINN